MSHEVEAVGVPSSLAALLGGIVDYAGTFPPARLDVPDAVARYAGYKEGPDAWMLNRFVLAARDLAVFEREAVSFTSEGDPWRLSVVCGGKEDVDLASQWISRLAIVESLEVRHRAPPAVAGREVFVELPLPCERRALRELRDQGAMLKIRLGSEQPALLPTSSQVAQVLSDCAELGLSLKATAGLHRAIRSDSYGFVNLLLAAALAHDGGRTANIESLLDESDSGAFAFEEDSTSWRTWRVALETISKARRFFRSFGSCSFSEPLESLAELGLRTP